MPRNTRLRAPANRCSAAIRRTRRRGRGRDRYLAGHPVSLESQALIDAGVVEGAPSVEADELAAAHKRIAALKRTGADRDACELFDEQAVVPPKRRSRSLKG